MWHKIACLFALVKYHAGYCVQINPLLEIIPHSRHKHRQLTSPSSNHSPNRLETRNLSEDICKPTPLLFRVRRPSCFDVEGPGESILGAVKIRSLFDCKPRPEFVLRLPESIVPREENFTNARGLVSSLDAVKLQVQ